MGPAKNALVRTTAVPTFVSMGVASNVVPTHSDVTLDMRTLPGDEGNAPLQHLLRMLQGAGLRVVGKDQASEEQIKLAWSQVCLLYNRMHACAPMWRYHGQGSHLEISRHHL